MKPDENPRWGTGSYGRRPRAVPSESGLPQSHDDAEAGRTVVGTTWDRGQIMPLLPAASAHPNARDRAIARYFASLPDHVYNAAALEGNPYTLPEVQTLMDGVTVGGHRLDDERQILALVDANHTLTDLVRANAFTVDKPTSDTLHGLVAHWEALESGHFRGEGPVGGGGRVILGDLPAYQAPETERGAHNLRIIHANLVTHLSRIEHPVERGMVYFSAATRAQFYFDGNKRTARLMMNGILTSAGHDAINIPYRRRIEFNTHLRTLFQSGDATDLMRFLLSTAS